MASNKRQEQTADYGTIAPKAGATSKEDWIGNQLKQVYDEALSEDIPEDMLLLLASLDEAEEKSSESEEAE